MRCRSRLCSRGKAISKDHCWVVGLSRRCRVPSGNDDSLRYRLTVVLLALADERLQPVQIIRCVQLN